MAAINPTHPPSSQPLTKPVDWGNYMVTAALKVASDAQKSPATYPTTDTARLDILDTLNWYEAHREYAWPDFIVLGYSFSEAMRLRRQLVSDVEIALGKSGNLRVGRSDVVMRMVSPESMVGGKRSAGGRMSERKRHCKREVDGSDTEVASSDDEDAEFLVEVAQQLITMAGVDGAYLPGEKDVDALVAAIRAGLVEHGEEASLAPDGAVSQGVLQK